MAWRCCSVGSGRRGERDGRVAMVWLLSCFALCVVRIMAALSSLTQECLNAGDRFRRGEGVKPTLSFSLCAWRHPIEHHLHARADDPDVALGVALPGSCKLGLLGDAAEP